MKWWEWVQRATNVAVLTVTLGFPTILLSVWSWINGQSANGLIQYIEVRLEIFFYTLWSVIGLSTIYSFLRGKRHQRKFNSEWGLRPESIKISHVNASNTDGEWCAVIFIRNRLPWALKVRLVDVRFTIEDRLADIPLPAANPDIILPNDSCFYRSPLLRRGSVPSAPDATCRLKVLFEYGHPDDGFTRRMARHYQFNFCPGNVPHGSDADTIYFSLEEDVDGPI